MATSQTPQRPQTSATPPYSGKNASASTSARAVLRTPVSRVMARRARAGTRHSTATPAPTSSDSAFWATTAGPTSSRNGAPTRRLEARPPTTISSSITSTVGSTAGRMRAARAGLVRASRMPRAKGATMRSSTSTSTSTGLRSTASSTWLAWGDRPAQKARASGVTSAAIELDTVVSETDSATSPRARWVSRFDMLPAGPDTTSSIPSATDGGRSRAATRPRVSSGTSTNWAAVTATKTRGWRSAERRSSTRTSRAMPSSSRPIISFTARLKPPPTSRLKSSMSRAVATSPTPRSTSAGATLRVGTAPG